MAEINVRVDQRQLTEIGSLSNSENERRKSFGRLLDQMSQLYQTKYEVPKSDISLIQTDINSFGESEPLQINTWWTASDNWPIVQMCEVGSFQIALSISSLDLPEGMMVTSTIEQKGIDPTLNKTIFVMGYIDEAGNICTTQERPQIDEAGHQLFENGKPLYELVEVHYSQEDVKKLTDSLK